MDQSGSMDCVRDQTISSVNEFIQEQKKEKGEAVFTFTKFNTKVTTVYEKRPMAEVKEITRDQYKPEGMTALYDAVGHTVTKYRDDKDNDYVVVILTDGQENSSKEYSQFAIKEMVRKQRAAGWEFIFLGANIDAFSTGSSLGIQHNVQYSYANLESCCKQVNDNVKMYRKSKVAGRAAFQAHSDATRSVPQQSSTYSMFGSSMGGRGK